MTVHNRQTLVIFFHKCHQNECAALNEGASSALCLLSLHAFYLNLVLKTVN